MKIQSRINTLTVHLNYWIASKGKQHVAAEVVSTIERLGLRETLNNEGISFARSGDIFKDTRVNAQKLFRWLGYYDDIEIHKEHLFDMEQVIVAAMPVEIRMAYLQEVYVPAGVAVSPLFECPESGINLAAVISILIKEDTDAHLAVLELTKDSNRHTLVKAEKELTEAIAVKTNTLAAVRKELDKA